MVHMGPGRGMMPGTSVQVAGPQGARRAAGNNQAATGNRTRRAAASSGAAESPAAAAGEVGKNPAMRGRLSCMVLRSALSSTLRFLSWHEMLLWPPFGDGQAWRGIAALSRVLCIRPQQALHKAHAAHSAASLLKGENLNTTQPYLSCMPKFRC